MMASSCVPTPQSKPMEQFAYLHSLPEDLQIATLIRQHALPLVCGPKLGCSIIGKSRTDWYALQNPKDATFDPTFPPAIGGRRSERASRQYWVVDLLRWRIRLAAAGKR